MGTKMGRSKHNPAARFIARRKRSVQRVAGATISNRRTDGDLVGVTPRGAARADRRPLGGDIPGLEKILKIVVAKVGSIPTVAIVLGGTAALRLPIGAGGRHFCCPETMMCGRLALQCESLTCSRPKFPPKAAWRLRFPPRSKAPGEVPCVP
jgi:hypothetical protein